MQINPEVIINNKILKPSAFTQVQQVGIDLTVSERVILENGESLNVLLNEIAKLPIHIYATFTHRSSYNRRGILITGSIYDPGYEGVIGCTIYNLSGQKIDIPINERIGQMLFFEANPASGYNGQYQGEHL